MSALRERKRQLVAESDVYRETLRLEVQNLQLYSVGVRQKLNALRAMNPVLMGLAALMGLPLGGALRPRRKRNWLRLVMTSFAGWQMYRRVAPLIQIFLSRSKARKETASAAAEAEMPAAGI